MAGSVLVLAGCNKTPAETENEVVSPDASGVVIDVDATSGATMDDSAASSFDETSLTGDESLTSGADTASVDEAANAALAAQQEALKNAGVDAAAVQAAQQAALKNAGVDAAAVQAAQQAALKAAK